MAASIRRLSAADIDTVVAFSVRAWAPNAVSFEDVLGSSLYLKIYPDWDQSQAEDVEKVCRDEKILVWVGAVDDVPVGFIAVIVADDMSHAEIEMLAVDPDFQGRGIGGDLMDVAMAHIAELGVSLVDIGTGGDVGHAAARRVYEKAGFTPLPLVRYYKQLP
jgi:ribosomal protein S18 acetylase RimI-like enzyme